MKILNPFPSSSSLTRQMAIMRKGGEKGKENGCFWNRAMSPDEWPRTASILSD